MSRTIFFILFVGFFFVLDLYVYQGFKVFIKRWIPDHTSLFYLLYWILPAVLLITILIKSSGFIKPTNHIFFVFTYSIFIALFLAKLVWLFFILTDDTIRLFQYSSNQIRNTPSVTKISRSDFIITTGFLTASALFTSLIYGIVSGAHNYTIQKRKLPIRKLPKSFEGLRIVQISDIHSGSFWSKKSVQQGIDMINELKPDLFFFTGDLVNNTADEFDDYKAMFSSIKATYGAFSVLGNHDYGDYVKWPREQGLTKEQNIENLKKHHQDMGWKLLMNEHHIIEIEGQQLAILGVENWSAHRRFPKYGNLKDALNNIQDIETKLLLSHDPSHWRAEILYKNPSIKATFSGHTHGMQFGIDSKYYRWSPVKYQYPEWVDIYSENDQILYVNRGFGYLGYPGRFGFLPEITVFELNSA